MLKGWLPFLGQSLLLRFAMAVTLVLLGNLAFSQHDIALEKSVDRDSVRAGDTVTWTIRLLNENMTNVAGLQVRDTLLPGLTYIDHASPSGTNYDISNGVWMVGQALDASTAELVLTIRTRVEWEGMYMNIAEVIDMAGNDVDSEPDNEELLEDDMDKACVSVPITICSNLNDSVRVTLLPMFTNIQWFKDGSLIPANQGGTRDTFYITTAGTYSFTATQNGCPTLNCCPVVVKDSCYDLALRKTLAAGQNDTVLVGSLVQFTLEVFNQGDLPARIFSLIDHVDLSFFAPFNTVNNPPGNTTGDATLPYAWSNAGTSGKVSLNGELAPGESVQLPVTLQVVHGGQAINFAEIYSDDDRDQDSQPDSQEQDGNADHYTDNTINNTNGDEDDHDGATLTVIASAIGDYVWNDADLDGQQDPTESGVPGIIVHLYGADSTLIATDTTDANGGYFFPDLPPGNYYVQFEISTLPPGFEPTSHNTGGDLTDSDGDPISGWTGIIKLDPGEVDTTVDFGIFGAEFDLALAKNLAPGQSSLVDIGDDVAYTITISNEGNLPAFNIDVTDNIPPGLALSPNDPLWALTGAGDASYTFAGPLLPGQSDSVQIILTVLYGTSGQQIVNTAEITSATDDDGTVYTDLDSTPSNGNPDEDDLDDEEIELEPHDPTGWIYCDKTGRIITGGHITVVGPNGIPNSQVNIVHDGSEGYYEFYTDGTPGIYTLSYSHPNGFPLSPDCPPVAGAFDPTGMANPVILGADTLNANYIEDKTCPSNPYYMSFNLAPGDPIVLHNNLPVQCILIASIACDDTNHNDAADAGDQPLAGATVYLYNCADPTTPIMTSITDAEGHYRFDGLQPGSYMVGYQLTPDVRPVASGVIDENGFSPCITLTWGQCDTNTVICLYQCPDVDAGPNIAHCNNTESSQLSASVPYGNGSFTWSPNNGLSNPYVANPVAMPSATTTYTVTFDDGKGCIDTDEMVLSIGNPKPILSYTPWADTTIDCTSPVVPFDAPIFADGCDDDLTVTLDSTVTNAPCGRTIVRVWTATNDNGNTASFTQTVNVVDSAPPVLFAIHPFFGEIHHGDTLLADCTQIPSLDSLGFSAFDFCSATTHNFTENVAYGNCATDGFLQSRYCGWTATDACGNTDSLYFWVIISDHTPPTLSGIPADESLPCGTALPTVPTVTSTDLCDGVLPVTFTQTQSGSGCNLAFTRTWSAVDACGNIATATQTIQLTNDNQPPVLVGIPANTSGTCGNIPPVPSNITATDNCDSAVEVSFNETISGTACDYTLTRSWTATDDCGLTTTAVQVITLSDDDTPVLVGVPTFTTASCGYVPAPPVVTATDGCDTNVPVTFNQTQTGSGCSYSLTRTWTATDDCGHTTSATQTIQVVDDRGPEISVTAPGLTWLSHGDTLIRQCNQIISLTSNSAVAVDSCCSALPSVVFHEFVTAGSCEQDGYLQLMTCGWVATDCCGNVDSLFFTVIVTDTIPPKFYGVPSDLTLPCGQLPPNGLPNVVALDNCSNNLTVSLNTDTVAIVGGYQLIRTWSATDACGNTGTKTQTITVTLEDLVPPVISNVPTDLNLDCGAAIPPPGSVAATDFCDATPSISFNETISGNAGCQTITRTWTATDDAGNVATASQVITVSDSVPPAFNEILPQNLAVACNNMPPAAALTATDNCDQNVAVVFGETQQGDDCNYTLTRTWTATDDCGNLTVAQQTITVTDNQAPIFNGSIPQNLAVACNNVPPAAALTATDNCDQNVAVVFGETQQGDNCNYTLTRTWTATDDCGNQTIAQQTIIVTDNQAPIFNGALPQNLAVACNNVPPAATLTATDNCDQNVAVVFGETQQGDDCNYTLTRIWTATDDCGNQTVAQQIVTVVDNSPPVLFATHAYFGEIHHGDTLLADCGQIPALDSLGFSAYDLCGATTVDFTETVVQGNCAEDGYTELRHCGWIATDACGNLDSLFFTIIISDLLPPVFSVLPTDTTFTCGQVPPVPAVTSMDNCGQPVNVVFQEAQAGIGCAQTITRTWTATDDCGNVATHSQVLNLSDTEPPTFVGVLPQDITVGCADMPAATTLLAMDNCDSDVPVVYSESQMGSGCNYQLTRTWTATDDCGNQIIAQQIVSVEQIDPVVIEFTNPSLNGLGDGDTLVIACSNPSIFDANDAVGFGGCSDSIAVIFKENGITPGNCMSPALGGDGFIVIMHCTWTATDTCGNTASATLHIMVVDTVAPIISSVPPDITIGCADALPACGNPTAIDDCGTASLTSNTSTVTTENGFDQICTWTATDACGNVATATSVVHVVENGTPIFVGVPSDTIVFLANGQAVPPVATVTATDGCPAQPLPVSFNQTSSPMGTDGCITKITRTWAATDDEGNSVVQQQQITVVGFNEASIASTTPDTCGNGQGSAVLLPSSYSFAWSNGASGASQNDLTPGNYMVTATNNGCTKVLMVSISDVQATLAITAINTTPENCGDSDGTAVIEPANYTYAWSDGGTGANRIGLAAGNYSVTAYEGNCSMPFFVNIANGCDCIPAVLGSLNIENADCGVANGSAMLNIAGNPADYSYLWIPNLGMPNATGNARTALPAQHYIVLVTYQGDNNCVEKFEFDVADDCPRCAPFFPQITLSASDDVLPTTVCIPLPFSKTKHGVLELNGQPLSATQLTACDEQQVKAYEFDTIAPGRLNIEWAVGTKTYRTTATNLHEVATFMSYLDKKTIWFFEQENNHLVAVKPKSGYGHLVVQNIQTGSVDTVLIQAATTSAGTSVYLTAGNHTLTYSDTLLRCSERIKVRVLLEQAALAEHASLLQDDFMATRRGEVATSDLLSNDALVGKYNKLGITEQPANGFAWVNPDQTVSYRPLIDYCNSKAGELPDHFTYEVCFENGVKIQAIVQVAVECRDDEAKTVSESIAVYPNPVSRFVNLDVSALAGQALEVRIYSHIGVNLKQLHLEEAPTSPIRMELEELPAGHYVIWIKPDSGQPIVRQLIVNK